MPNEGEILSPDGIGESGSMTDGPGVRLTFRLGPDGRIVEARFRTTRFEDARPVASALCEALVGATPEDASRISAGAVAALARVPEGHRAARIVFFAKCACLLPFLGRSVYVGSGITCVCFGIETARIRATVREHSVTTVHGLRAFLPAGSGCGTCRPELEELIAEERAGPGDDDGTRPTA